MSSPAAVSDEIEEAPRQLTLRKLYRSRWTFIGLQGLDLLTTLAAFHMGAFEVNPMVAHLTVHFGRVGGVFLSKLIAVVIAMGVKRLVWLINLLYTAVVFWNVIVLILLSLRH